MIEEGKFYSTGKVAKILCMRPITVKRWAESKKIKSIRTPGGRYLIPETEVKKLLGIKEHANKITMVLPAELAEKFEEKIGEKYGKKITLAKGIEKILKEWVAKRKKERKQ